MWQPPRLQKPWYVQPGRCVVGFRVDCCRPREGMPAELSCGRGHPIGELGAAQGRHWIRAPARPLEDVAARVDGAIDVAGLARNADLVLDLVIIGLEFVQAERPVLHGRSFGNPAGAVAAARLAHDLEVPWIEPPALRPIVQRGAADCIHHGVDRQPRRIGRRCIRPMGRDLAVRLLRRLRPAAKIVAQLIGSKIAWRKPGASLEADHLEPRLRERQRGDPADSAEPDDNDIRLPKVGGHDRLPSA